MSLSFVYARAIVGVESPQVSVETHLSNGLPSFTLVGLPEAAVKESRERVRSAIINSGFEFPMRRVTVNLAPADLPKEGGRFDLAIAISLLAASGQVQADQLHRYEFVAELALSGACSGVRGILPSIRAASDYERSVFIAPDNADEASLSQYVELFSAKNLRAIVEHINRTATDKCPRVRPDEHSLCTTEAFEELDIAQVRGQFAAKKALLLAAAGGHNLLFYGPPGTGKSMLASRLPSLLPELSNAEALEVASIHSLAQVQRDKSHWKIRPYRSPHHSTSAVALVGGGARPRPGEVSLSHRGVLFLDELPEYSRHVLEVLREPIEAGEVSISRAAHSARFPAQFQLIAAMNPCPCGYLGHPHVPCKC